MSGHVSLTKSKERDEIDVFDTRLARRMGFAGLYTYVGREARFAQD